MLGHGFRVNPDGRYLLVGGGIGVPPLRGCAQTTMGKSTAILGFRNKGKAILIDRFEEDREAMWLVQDHTTRQGWDKNLSSGAWTLESPL